MTDFSRRGFMAIGAGAALSTGLIGCGGTRPPARLPTVALTVDNFSSVASMGMTAQARNTAIMDALASQGIKGAGFVAGKTVDDADGKAIVQALADAGHIIGNATYSRPKASETSIADFKADILKNAAFLDYFGETSNLFRFPFLDEGDRGEPAVDGETKDERMARQDRILEKRDAYRALLKELGLKNAAVTLPTKNYHINKRMVEHAQANTLPKLDAYRDFYIDYVREGGLHFQAIARDLGLDGIAQTMFIHHNALNALYLKDVMATLKSEGWNFVDADAAFKQGVFDLQPKAPSSRKSLLTVLESEAASVGDHVLRVNPISQDEVIARLDAAGL